MISPSEPVLRHVMLCCGKHRLKQSTCSDRSSSERAAFRASAQLDEAREAVLLVRDVTFHQQAVNLIVVAEAVLDGKTEPPTTASIASGLLLIRSLMNLM